MGLFDYSRTLVAGAPENVNDVQAMLNELKALVNGNLDAANLAAGAVGGAELGQLPSIDLWNSFTRGLNPLVWYAFQYDSERHKQGGMLHTINQHQVTVPLQGIYLCQAFTLWSPDAEACSRITRITRGSDGLEISACQAERSSDNGSIRSSCGRSVGLAAGETVWAETQHLGTTSKQHSVSLSVTLLSGA